MQTLEELRLGKLSGITRLTLRENLTAFPTEIFQLADSLEILDLSGNQLSTLPDNLADLTNLKILFCSNNLFTEVPEVLSSCPKLEMVGFKSNKIRTFSETALPKQVKWLILTDNKIEKLPESFGQLTQLRKCALAGNQIKSIPSTVKGCQSLELIRISANQLIDLPDELLSLPKLAWLAFSGNPLSSNTPHQVKPETDDVKYQNLVALNQLEIHEQLGEGASGFIHKARWSKDAISNALHEDKFLAAKLFKGAVTSDGYPEDELAICLKVGKHPNLVEMIAPIQGENQSGMLMSLIPKSFKNLGNPPSLKTCTRDTFDEKSQLSATTILQILKQVVDTMTHLHDCHVSHGDLYAHNILFNADNKILLGDFGAASDFSVLPESQQTQIRLIELKAFANLAEDLEGLLSLNETHQSDLVTQISQLIQAIRNGDIPNFQTLMSRLES